MDPQQKILTSLQVVNTSMKNFIEDYDQLNKESRSNILNADHLQLNNEIDEVLPALKKSHNILKKAKSHRNKLKNLELKKEILIKTKLFKKKLRELKCINRQMPTDQFPALKDLRREASVSIEEEKLETAPQAVTRGFCCYVCNTRYYAIHHFYPRMCPQCGDFNYSKRQQKCDLSGKIALVTGGRIKIGYEICIILLRNGCRVIITTRFPQDCLSRYQKEPDFESFKDRLEIYPLDLRQLPLVAKFCKMISQKLPHLDILINNAAQTIRRETTYYKHLLENEVTGAQNQEAPCLPRDFGYGALKNAEPFKIADLPVETVSPLEPATTIGLDCAVPVSVTASQLVLIPESKDDAPKKFPKGVLDINQQQVDLSQTNSWIMSADDVQFPEFMEAQVINAWAPYLLAVNLKEMIMKSPNDKRFIVNVTSMEGIFRYRSKRASHPHTNMAKAALNMFTRTSAQEYAKDGIYMTAVDTGWVSMMTPMQIGDPEFEEKYCMIPLDEIDGAMRVLDPIFAGYNENKLIYGKFLKNYAQAEW